MGTVSKESPERQRYLKLKAESVKTPNPTVLYEIGQCYANGLGTDKDIHRAFEHFLNSANNGLDIAQVRLGQCYAEGLGIEKDVHKAAEWYKKASEAGNHDAKNALAKLLPAANTIPAIDKYQQAKITPQISIDEEVIETLKDGGMLANSVFKVKSKFRIKIKKVYCSSKEYDRESAVLNDLGHLFSNQYHPEKEFFLECLDQFPTSQTNYFEYCETSLERYFDTTARKLYEGRELFLLTTLKTQIIPALKFLHSQGICHMDIKANNILGKVHDGYYSWKISDFDHSVKIGQEFGEPGYYRAPEVAKGMKLKEKLFAKDCIDIWALGCMIGDLLTNFTFYKEVEQDSLFL